MAFLFKGPKLPKVEDPPPPPEREDPAVQEARRKALITAAAQRGRSATISSGALGDTSAAPVQRKRLLGA